MDSKITDAYLNLYNKKDDSKEVRMSNLYEQVYEEGTNEDHNIADRNDVGYKDPRQASGDLNVHLRNLLRK